MPPRCSTDDDNSARIDAEVCVDIRPSIATSEQTGRIKRFVDLLCPCLSPVCFLFGACCLLLWRAPRVAAMCHKFLESLRKPRHRSALCRYLFEENRSKVRARNGRGFHRVCRQPARFAMCAHRQMVSAFD